MPDGQAVAEASMRPPESAIPQPTTTASADNPFGALPWPSPGDRIRADDFRMLSRALSVLYEVQTLAGTLNGRRFAEAKVALAAQHYQIQQALTVFGTAASDPGDASLDDRLVLHIASVVPGERRVLVLLTEAVDTRQLMPNLLGVTYRDAADRLRVLLGEPAPGATPISVPQLVGLPLGEARAALTGQGR